MDKITLNLTPYFYKGSSNSTLTLVQYANGDIDLITDFGEVITTVQSGYSLMRALEDLGAGKFA